MKSVKLSEAGSPDCHRLPVQQRIPASPPSSSCCKLHLECLQITLYFPINWGTRGSVWLQWAALSGCFYAHGLRTNLLTGRRRQHGLLALQLNIATSHIQHEQLFREAWKVDCGCTSSWTSVKDTVPKSICFTFPSRAADAPLSESFIASCATQPIGSIVILHLNDFSFPPSKTHLLSFNSVIRII